MSGEEVQDVKEVESEIEEIQKRVADAQAASGQKSVTVVFECPKHKNADFILLNSHGGATTVLCIQCLLSAFAGILGSPNVRIERS